MGRGDVGIFFGTLRIDNIFKTPLLAKQTYKKKMYFSMSCLFKYYVSILGGGWRVQAHAYYAYIGGVGGLE